MRADLMLNMRLNRRRSKRRGAALVLVMIFGVGALMLVTTMMAMAESSVRQAGDLHSQKNLVTVLKTGLASAMNEVSRNDKVTSGEYDPNNDGVGALVGTSGAGIEVKTPGGLLLGRYRATIDKVTHPGKTILRVVAVWPDFTDPKRVVAAEAEVARSVLMGDANPLSIVHDVSETAGSKFEGINQTNLTITAPDADVPAANITNTWLHTQFNNDVVNSGEDVTIAGADPTDPGTLVSGSATVTNGGDGALDEDLMLSLRAQLVQKAITESTAANTAGKTLPSSLGSDQLGLVGPYYAPNDLEIPAGTTLTGSGTLIVGKKLVVKGELDWDGEIIVIGDMTAPDTQNSTIELESGGKFDVDGFVFQIGQDVLFKAMPGGASDRQIDGGLILLAAQDNDVTLEFKGGSGSNGFIVDGIMASYANTTVAHFENGLNFDLEGSLALINQTGQADNKIELKIPGKLNLTFSDPTFRESLEDLSDYLPPDDPNKPLILGSYWERSALSILADQTTQLASGSSWGKED